jgi:hypothetical protein
MTSERTGDRIVLTLPGDDRLYEIASLVIGGIGSRLDLPYESLDNLQLAAVSVLSASDAATVTLEVVIEENAVSVTIGPLPAAEVSDEGRRRVLARLVDAVETRPDESSSGGSITLRLARPTE